MLCDSCLEVALDNGASSDIAEEVLTLMGEDIADHICDEIEEDGVVHCDCACKPEAKLQLRQSIPQQ